MLAGQTERERYFVAATVWNSRSNLPDVLGTPQGKVGGWRKVASVSSDSSDRG
jgi:hypothetical protein